MKDEIEKILYKTFHFFFEFDTVLKNIKADFCGSMMFFYDSELFANASALNNYKNILLLCLGKLKYIFASLTGKNQTME
ncbi:MAG: hypothetical protein MK515_00575 [SAR324 cluster bacterium]|jgi:hypothetical protein|nr:hypothetical protein [SAR324 cluster bacterium]MCH2264943.1 hypothetical protein [SAR324 cluster bacterium]